MKRKAYLILICSFIGLLQGQAQGQLPDQPSIYTTASGRERTASEIETLRTIYANQQQNSQFDRLRNFSSNSSNSSMMSLYTKDQQQLITNLSERNNTETARYKQFLKQSKTGVNILLKENICLNKDGKENMSKAEKDCLSQSLPGKGAYFSFRQNNYIFSGWADIGFTTDWFFSIGYLTQSIFAQIGDVPIENVTLQSEGIKFLTDFVPANTLEGADKQQAELEKGVKDGNFFYFSAVKPFPNQTYFLRSIAYQGKFVKVFNIDGNKTKIDFLNGDERKDIIVVFRVIGVNEKGNLQIIWKVLLDKKSPKLEVPEQEINPTQIRRKVTKID